MGQLRNDCDSIHQSIGNMSAMSSNNATQMMDILRQLQDQVGLLAASQDQTAKKGKGVDEVTDNVLLAIQRLCSLVNEKERTLNEAETEDITDDIQKLLTHLKILSQEDFADVYDGRRLDRGQWSGRELKRDLRTIEGLALASRDIAINQPSECKYLSCRT